MKNKNWLYLFISVMPPFIFMFYFYARNSSYLNYWHVFIVAITLAFCGAIFYWIVALVGKSSQAASLMIVVFWILFFIIGNIYRKILLPIVVRLSRLSRYSILFILIILFLVVVFCIGHRLRKKEPFLFIAVFEAAIFLLNIVPATFSFVSSKNSPVSDLGYVKTFNIDSDTLTPNIYWLFMDGMLGFKAMEDLFDDSQLKFESHLIERGFLVNREAQFEIGHATVRAVPALMSPNYYDSTMTPILTSINLDNYDSSQKSLTNLDTIFGRRNNELLLGFNARGYQTNILAISLTRYFYPVTTHYYINGKELKINGMDVSELASINQLEELFELLENTALSGLIFTHIIIPFIGKFKDNSMEMINIKSSGIDKKSIYGAAYPGGDTWHIDALAKIMERPEPQICIIHDSKAHFPFYLNEDGSTAARTERTILDPYNYPPQHRYVRNMLVNFIDLIIASDPDAVIVIQADHGLHSEETRKQMLAISGGDAEKVRLMQNQTMSAVRIPERWGGLDVPLDPLNITRELVNRYVGPNYELLDAHP
ncbi:hypothetical protein TREPR_3730 [Treponema primitia ZAS-2]|uniref:Sulfatase N-terminal domain-containing protein n=1 Tax=Treponema primitia (strain ATCC BAA-887 / DSM 12427 / ZAS-2) TaxID=545694 RepID=F5YQB0_TREPZ|nr:hypothetical protein [Treponema primitia]AEF83541.1 hypothetical protein TREPR_3730 [Treponema primitia ZAS-2]